MEKLRHCGSCSAADNFMVQTLRNVAKDGWTVISSVQKPSTAVFALFDHLTLLSFRRTVYCGEAASASQVSHLHLRYHHFITCHSGQYLKFGKGCAISFQVVLISLIWWRTSLQHQSTRAVRWGISPTISCKSSALL